MNNLEKGTHLNAFIGTIYMENWEDENGKLLFFKFPNLGKVETEAKWKENVGGEMDGKT